MSQEGSIVGSAAGGVVSVTLRSTLTPHGGLTCSAVHVDPSALDPEDPSLLEDLVLAAINDALGKVEPPPARGEAPTAMLGGLAGLGADLPGLLASGLPGLGASLPELISGAMEALGLSAPPRSENLRSESPSSEPPAEE